MLTFRHLKKDGFGQQWISAGIQSVGGHIKINGSPPADYGPKWNLKNNKITYLGIMLVKEIELGANY